jgi:PAS domain S-box-containing protein
LQDVTEIKKNQAKLVRSEENYKNLFSENPTPMWTYDQENKQFSMVNDAALELYGYRREEFLKLGLFDIRPEEEHERLREQLNKLFFADNKKTSAEWVHLRKDKTKVNVEIVSHQVEIDGRKSRLVTIKDITDRKLAQEEILGQNQRLREIAQISSHETRKPLASILGLVSLFDKIKLDSPLNREIIQYLEVTANELDQVIHEIVRKTWKEDETLTGDK